MKEFEKMTVKELREESRERRLTLEKNGKKFTKAELIERLVKYEEEQEEIEKEMERVLDGEEQKTENTENGIKFAKTIEEIEQKYANRKSQEVYDRDLKPGGFVVYMHYIEAKSGWIGKKIRTAKVVGVNRKKEIVRVVTAIGTEKILSFNELLYIRGNGTDCTYPKDINLFLRKQRERGRKENGRNGKEVVTY